MAVAYFFLFYINQCVKFWLLNNKLRGFAVFCEFDRLSLVDLASEFISINDEIHARAKKIQEFGIKTYDSLHIACAENGHADIFLTTDDRLIKAVKRNFNEIKIEVENPLLWLYKVI